MSLYVNRAGFTCKEWDVPARVTQCCLLLFFHRAGWGTCSELSLQEVEAMNKREWNQSAQWSFLPAPHWSASPDPSQSRPHTPPGTYTPPHSYWDQIRDTSEGLVVATPSAGAASKNNQSNLSKIDQQENKESCSEHSWIRRNDTLEMIYLGDWYLYGCVVLYFFNIQTKIQNLNVFSSEYSFIACTQIQSSYSCG